VSGVARMRRKALGTLLKVATVNFKHKNRPIGVTCHCAESRHPLHVSCRLQDLMHSINHANL
jgi:hypothetical protein